VSKTGFAEYYGRGMRKAGPAGFTILLKEVTEKSSNMTTVCFAKLIEETMARCTVYTMCGVCNNNKDQVPGDLFLSKTREERNSDWTSRRNAGRAANGQWNGGQQEEPLCSKLNRVC
jgi:hypothetical protein